MNAITRRREVACKRPRVVATMAERENDRTRDSELRERLMPQGAQNARTRDSENATSKDSVLATCAECSLVQSVAPRPPALRPLQTVRPEIVKSYSKVPGCSRERDIAMSGSSASSLVVAVIATTRGAMVASSRQREVAS